MVNKLVSNKLKVEFFPVHHKKSKNLILLFDWFNLSHFIEEDCWMTNGLDTAHLEQKPSSKKRREWLNSDDKPQDRLMVILQQTSIYCTSNHVADLKEIIWYFSHLAPFPRKCLESYFSMVLCGTEQHSSGNMLYNQKWRMLLCNLPTYHLFVSPSRWKYLTLMASHPGRHYFIINPGTNWDQF